MGLHSRLISIIIGLSVLAGMHCARAVATDQRSIETMVPSPLLLPAEADPVFQQKLVQRIRGPYERSHLLNLWALAD
jgi:hypothetical protein